MYIPEFNRIRDNAVALGFMKANPFAILVCSTDTEPFATHIPILVREVEEQIVLRGHMAKANPHWQWMKPEQECLVIFHGAHAYISPSLYENRESVPTWNYAAVHVYGKARLIFEPEPLLEILHDSIQMFDPSYEDQWSGLREEYRNRMLSHIVGFEIVAERLEGKFKLSQNRTKTEQARVRDTLSASTDSAVAGVGELMRAAEIGSGRGK
jgi:transcriptional regulator